jgi:hypothetical protein
LPKVSKALRYFEKRGICNKLKRNEKKKAIWRVKDLSLETGSDSLDRGNSEAKQFRKERLGPRFSKIK